MRVCENEKTRENCGFPEREQIPGQMVAAGLEERKKSSGKTVSPVESGSKSGSICGEVSIDGDSRLRFIVDHWPALPEGVKVCILQGVTAGLAAAVPGDEPRGGPPGDEPRPGRRKLGFRIPEGGAE